MKSIKMKLITGISLIIAGFVILVWVLNNFFLLKLYIYNNKNKLLKIAETLEKIGVKNQEKIFEIERENGIFILCFDKDMNFIDNKGEMFKAVMKGFDERNPDFKEPPEIGGIRKPLFIEGPERPELKIKEEIKKMSDKKYKYSYSSDMFKNINFIDLTYKNSDNSYTFIRKPYEVINENKEIAMKFMIVSGVAAIISGVFFAYYFAGKISNPILEINNRAKKISELNFEHGCIVKGNDEISELADSINKMSNKLSCAIEELKVKNSSLEKEIENEKKLEKMRREFISNVSHELKTPISLIAGYAEGLKYSVIEDNGEKESYCDVIIDEAAKMDRLIKDLLELSVIQNGGAAFEYEKLEISQLIGKIVNKFKIKFNESGIKVLSDIEKNVIITADCLRIEQVISNFLDNAIKNCSGKKEIAVIMKEKEEKLYLSVYNSGRNIDEEVAERIWESFYKLDESRNREAGGAGLGLAISAVIIKQHKGNYGFNNCVDGVVFWFEIPTKNSLYTQNT